MNELSAPEIRKLFAALDGELSRAAASAELYVLGGAVMCLVFAARPATKDVDAYFLPANTVREAARRVALAHEVPENWLNDAAKGYLSDRAEFSPFLDLANLKVFTATPEYLLAMKCLSMRLGAEFHDASDVRFLLRYLNLTKLQEVQAILEKYYPIERFPPKTFFALEEMLQG